jgi:putative peptide zinc metalloprotease protein
MGGAHTPARWACALTCLVALALAPAAQAQTSDGGAKQVVIAQSTSDNVFAGRAGLQMALDPGDTVGNENIASASSSDCTGCRANAVAIQAVVVSGDPSTFTPHNVATAVNSNCVSCTSYAYAYQYVIQTDGRVRLSTDGRAELSDLRSEARSIAASDDPPDQMTAELDDVVKRFKSVLSSELDPTGASASRHVDD